jgi:DNA-binding response OmpR family regulator
MRVLVIEDEKKTALFIRKALQSEGFAVDVCHQGDVALNHEFLFMVKTNTACKALLKS